MARIRVKILKDCVLGTAGNEMNLLESQLPRFASVCEVVGGYAKAPKKKVAGTKVEGEAKTPDETKTEKRNDSLVSERKNNI